MLISRSYKLCFLYAHIIAIVMNTNDKHKVMDYVFHFVETFSVVKSPMMITKKNQDN